ncbi:properdin-like [Cetorhinus maximus]
MNNRILLVISTLCLFTTPTEAGKVSCFSGVDRMTGICTDLIGHDIEEEDCCLNTNYCYQRESSGTSHYCRRNSQWTEWTEWSACTVSCSEGVQQRRRFCIGRGRCHGRETLQTRFCVDQACCAVNGGWSLWSSWTSCSVTCATGQQERRRSCSEPPPSCGGQCPGPEFEVQFCDTNQICPTHGSWSSWGNWGSCGQSCQREEPKFIPVRKRSRVCSSPAPSHSPPGKPCPGSNTETGPCEFLPFCPVPGNWGPWSELSACSTSCGIGKAQLRRECDHPAPKHGGAKCPGSGIKDTFCNTKIPCPVDGIWTVWSMWSECVRINWTISCRKYVGQQNRVRRCVGREHDGEPCSGKTVEIRSCYNNDNCVYGKGIWSEWDSWSLCYPPCGDQSTRRRTRTCQPIYPDYPKERGVQKKVEIFFWGNPIYECDELQGESDERLPCQNVPDCA